MRSLYSTITIGVLYCLTILVLLGMALETPERQAIAGEDRPAALAEAHTSRLAG